MSNTRYATTGPLGRSSVADGSSLLETVRVSVRLVLKQLNDEISLAKVELKRKGIQVGVAAAILAVALIILSFMVVALLVAAIAGLALIMPAWLAALLVAAFFLVLVLILAGIGALKIKKVMPLKPQEALIGLKHDVGIIKQGNKFDVTTLAVQPQTRAEAKARKAEQAVEAERAKAAREAKAAEAGPAPTEAQLLARTSDRRQHLLALRAELVSKADVKKQARSVLASVQDSARHSAAQARGRFGTPAAAGTEDLLESAKERWVPLTVLAVSAAAFVVFLRRLLQK